MRWWSEVEAKVGRDLRTRRRLDAAFIANAALPFLIGLAALPTSETLAADPPAAAPAIAVEEVDFGNRVFRICRFDPKQVRLDLVWQGADGQPMKTFRAVEAGLAARGRRLALAMNAGIYEPGLVPSGLHVQEGETLVPLNREDGEGNFFLKPNGVFYLNADGSGGVMEATAYAAADKTPRLAVQSGPVLVVDGVIHPAFREGSPNVRFRNGIGVDSEGRVVMANSVMREGNDTNFHNFARLFRDRLDCRSALYLDGDISELYVRAVDGEVAKEKNWFAAMFVVSEAVPEE